MTEFLRGSPVEFGTIQRRLAWPLCQDDTHPPHAKRHVVVRRNGHYMKVSVFSGLRHYLQVRAGPGVFDFEIPNGPHRPTQHWKMWWGGLRPPPFMMGSIGLHCPLAVFGCARAACDVRQAARSRQQIVKPGVRVASAGGRAAGGRTVGGRRASRKIIQPDG